MKHFYKGKQNKHLSVNERCSSCDQEHLNGPKYVLLFALMHNRKKKFQSESLQMLEKFYVRKSFKFMFYLSFHVCMIHHFFRPLTLSYPTVIRALLPPWHLLFLVGAAEKQKGPQESLCILTLSVSLCDGVECTSNLVFPKFL